MARKGKREFDEIQQAMAPGDEEFGIDLTDLDPADISLIVRVFHFAQAHGMYLRDPQDRKQLVRFPAGLVEVMRENGIPYFPQAA